MEKIKYPVIEIFKSFQGEGSFLGVPSVFIRFAGCNLDCPWCDTKEQLRVSNTEYITAKEIASIVGTDYFNIVFTGGEPTLYDIGRICNAIFNNFSCTNSIYPHFSIETNGTRYIPYQIDHVVCSPKFENGYNIHESIKKRTFTTEYKFVVDDRLRVGDIVKNLSKDDLIYLQPEAGNYSESVGKACEMLEDLFKLGYLDARLGIQAHKFWGVR